MFTYRTFLTILLAAPWAASPAMLHAHTEAGDRYLASGRVHEEKGEWDDALADYRKALAEDPAEPAYARAVDQARLQAAAWHIRLGTERRAEGSIVRAIEEFAQAQRLDPASAVAAQELQAAGRGAALTPATREPISLRMAGQPPRILFETLAKLAGIDILFDPDYQAGKNATVELRDATLEQALDYMALLTRSAWKPVSAGAIWVGNDAGPGRK